MMGGFSSAGKSTWWITVLMALLYYDRKILIISNEENIKKFKRIMDGCYSNYNTFVHSSRSRS